MKTKFAELKNLLAAEIGDLKINYVQITQFRIKFKQRKNT